VSVYYNENDAYAAQWLRNLIAEGLIAPGDVDERDIRDVRAGDLAGYAQCHFFAGIGGWSLALRLAGWADDRPVWTGSCPCQPFSAAGAGKAADDERHLWPVWFPLIAECRPAIVFGEQVEAAIGWGWLDAVFADLEAEGYACGASVLPACGVGAPHIRQRVWFVADAADAEIWRWGEGRSGGEDGRPAPEPERLRDAGELAHTAEPRRDAPERARQRDGGSPPQAAQLAEHVGVGDASAPRLPARERAELPGPERIGEGRATEQPGRAPWADCDWLPCTDGKSRPVEPGTFPLAHGIPGRVGRLRAYGNAITPQVAAEFIRAIST
jgi:DNA (cytosine-5)-methyltransferase 1